VKKLQKGAAMDYKQALEQATDDWGYACYDPSEFPGRVAVARDGEAYDIHGKIDGVQVDAHSSEEGMKRTLEELNVDPKTGWRSL
jgi:hypothetical protein